MRFSCPCYRVGERWTTLTRCYIPLHSSSQPVAVSPRYSSRCIRRGEYPGHVWPQAVTFRTIVSFDMLSEHGYIRLPCQVGPRLEPADEPSRTARVLFVVRRSASRIRSLGFCTGECHRRERSKDPPATECRVFSVRPLDTAA